MQIFKTYKNIPSEAQNVVIAIGNFDAVHRGHQVLLGRAREKADALGKKLGVLSFEPHPRSLFRPDDPPFRITPASLKADRLESLGVDTIFAVPFDWDFASQSAEDFVENVLKRGLNPAHIIVGYDFCFGQLRKGSPETIKQAGLDVTIVEKVTAGDEEAISSSRIRAALRHGNIETANDLLGWEWEMRGEIVHGERRGHELGFPTANVPLGDTLHPAYGVYASLVKIEGEDDWRASATNIGIRPMFEVEEGLVEAHIFDFDEEIYGKILRVKPVKRLRGEAKFASVDDLIEQMGKDCDQAREILQNS